jgi:hypothetical protein
MQEKHKFWLIPALLIGIIHCVVLFFCNWGDAVIHFVFARNFSAGHFFEYNIGEKASGSTSPLWTCLLSLVHTLNPDGFIDNSKIFSILIYLSTFILIYFVGSKLYKNKTIGLYSVFLWTCFVHLAEYATTGMETPLYIAVLLLSLLLSVHIFSNNSISRIKIFLLGLVLGTIPIIRPEGIIFSLLIFGLVALFGRRDKLNYYYIVLMLLGFFLTFSPYYIFSYIKMGHLIPSSGQGRLLTAYEFSNNTFGIRWSPEAIKLFLRTIPLLCFLLAIHGLLSTEKKLGTDSPFILLISGWIIWNIFFFTFIFPDVMNIERYMYSVFPFLVLLAGYGLHDYITYIGTKISAKSVIVLLVVFFVLVNLRALKTSYLISQSAVPFDMVIEKELCDWLESNTDKNDLILTYEVQQKYCLDRSIISLDGIIDGKIIPYFYKKSDLVDFLERYKPQYWVVNNAIFYREIYKGTILRQVAKKLQDPNEKKCEIKGIGFKKVKNRPPDIPSYSNFAGYNYVLKIDYPITKMNL